MTTDARALRASKASPTHPSPGRKLGNNQTAKGNNSPLKNRGFPEKNHTSTFGNRPKSQKSTGKAGRNNSASRENAEKTALFHKKVRDAENTEGGDALRRLATGVSTTRRLRRLGDKRIPRPKTNRGKIKN
jgi:hypothetical protein